jgi:hypothetical protein
MKLFKKISVAAALLAGSSCTSDTVRTSAVTSDRNPINGMQYYLPKVLVPIKVSFGIPTPPKPPAPGATTTQTNNTSQNVTVNVSTPEEKKPNDPPKRELVISIGEPVYVPDERHKYVIEYIPSAFSDDNVQLRTDTQGLLQSIDTDATDRTGAVLIKLAELAGEATKLFTVLKSVPGDEGTAAVCTIPDYSLETYLDVSAEAKEPYSLQELQQLLANWGGDGADATKRPGIAIAFSPNKDDRKVLDAQNQKKPTEDLPSATADAAGNGLLFRQNQPYRLDVQLSSNEACKISGRKVLHRFAAPNDAPIYSVDTSRAPFVQKKVKYVVQNGMLTELQVVKPSEVLGAASIPVDLAKKIASIPAELLTFKLVQIQAENNLTAAEIEQIKNAIELLKQKQALEDQQQTTP